MSANEYTSNDRHTNINTSIVLTFKIVDMYTINNWIKILARYDMIIIDYYIHKKLIQ